MSENKKPQLISNLHWKKETDTNQSQVVKTDSTVTVKKEETTDENKINPGKERASGKHEHKYKTPTVTENNLVKKMNGEVETNDEIAAVDQDSDDSTQDSSNGENHQH